MRKRLLQASAEGNSFKYLPFPSQHSNLVFDTTLVGSLHSIFSLQQFIFDPVLHHFPVWAGGGGGETPVGEAGNQCAQVARIYKGMPI